MTEICVNVPGQRDSLNESKRPTHYLSVGR